MMKIIILLNIMFSIILLMMKSPLKSNLIILSQSLLLTLVINLMNKTSWISFMLFILYMSGLMIIFLYISSIAFNESFKNKINYKLIYMFIIMTMLTINMNKNIIFENFNYENNLIFEDNFYFINMFILPNNLMIYFIMMILFFMLISIIWMLKMNKGPIRQKNN
uniref:NADH dehydrogenase subunit 6 n=1 Tax=Aiceona himalaica TaxID=1064607 RepID=A0A1L1YND2_9HEMI|nr:NADH dehydrogenase subunit 6 [Aiceona himalaica]